MNEVTADQPNTQPPYIVGIDLGTTHCVLAYARADLPEGESPDIQIFPIAQVVNAGEVDAQPLLPSFLLLPGEHDVPQGALSLPWRGDMDYAVGEYARDRGAELPSRLITSAKSWLAYAGVDRTSEILPWNAPKEARRLSPVEAVSRFLLHMREAWNHEMAHHDPSVRLESQTVYLTVPASFDAIARELTLQAARQAGLDNLTLLEEPQAAFYAWLSANEGGWREQVAVGQSILVCDVGGGTTDFSLIQVTEQDGNLDLQRVAVGEHILLGGDNMDLTLAYAVRGKLVQQGTQLDDWQFRGLIHSCRAAKERLLNQPDLHSEPVVILGRGSSLIGGTIRTELTRDEIESILVNGFFPIGELDEHPQRNPQVGLQELGLPYEPDPAITRHLAKFLSQHTSQNGDNGSDAPFPSAVLFNGGVMKADPLRNQVLRALQHWSDNDDFHQFSAVDLDLSVALGAAYYGFARSGRGIRIRAGTARAYYVGVESSMPAVPGIPAPIKALCVVPYGMEEGSEADIIEREFGLVVGETALFKFLASSTRKEDKVGQIVDDWAGDIHEISVLETRLPASEGESGGPVVPVWLQTRIQPRQHARAAGDNFDQDSFGGVEIGAGVLEMWCIERDGDREWKLEFDVSYNPT